MESETEPTAKPPPLPVIGLASRWVRIVAALLDFTVVGLVTGFIEIEQAVENGEPIPVFGHPPIDEKRLGEMAAYSLAAFATFVWAYFFVSESLMRGGSLGKATFGIRVISLRSGSPPTALEAALRAAAKAFCFLDPRIFLPINLLVMAFNSQRRSGHDLMARTVVVSNQVTTLDPSSKAPQSD